MSVISGSIPNLINGVSQQPFALRLASQAEEQINAYSSIVEGLTKRPPTKHVARLQSAIGGASHLHIINRDVTERYVTVFTNGDLRVFDFQGNEKTVNFPNGKGYLASAGANFGATTIADFTFVVNRDVKTAMAAEWKPARGAESLVFIRQGNYATTYTVVINGGAVATYTTSATDPATIKTEFIATQLTNIIRGWGWTGTYQIGSLIHVVGPGGAAFEIRTEDSLGDTAITLIGKKLPAFTSLPAKGVPGYQVEITGSATNAFDNFYVEYDGGGGTSYNGVWREIPRPGRVIAFNAATMPHVLVREANGTFTFRQADWDKCKAGDENIVPEPSFIGSTISDLFFYRNRLGVISGENIVFTKTSEFFDWWRQSATALQETDPIDIAVSHVKVSILRHAIPFNETLLLFSDQTQFILGAAEGLSPATVSVSQTTEFEASLKAKPVGAGSFVYFVTNKNTASGVQEYYVTGDAATKDANEVTAHAPKYIEGQVFKMTASTNEDILAILSEAKRNEVYVYKYHYAGQDKVQSSWSKWRFGPSDVILQAEFIESALFLLIQRGDGVFLERLDIEPGRTDGSLKFDIHLDRRLTEAQVVKSYDPVTRRTTINLPYSETNPLQFVVAGPGGPRPPGFVIDPQVVDGDTITVPGDYTNVPFRVGRKYEMRYKFSPLLVRNEAPGGGQVANTEGRIQLRRMLINYADTGYFRVEVTPFRRDTYVYRFTGKVIGSAQTLLGESGVETGSFRFPLMANNMNVDIVIINDTPLPSRLLNADWEAQYMVRTKRMQ